MQLADSNLSSRCTGGLAIKGDMRHQAVDWAHLYKTELSELEIFFRRQAMKVHTYFEWRTFIDLPPCTSMVLENPLKRIWIMNPGDRNGSSCYIYIQNLSVIWIDISR